MRQKVSKLPCSTSHSLPELPHLFAWRRRKLDEISWRKSNSSGGKLVKWLTDVKKKHAVGPEGEQAIVTLHGDASNKKRRGLSQSPPRVRAVSAAFGGQAVRLGGARQFSAENGGPTRMHKF